MTPAVDLDARHRRAFGRLLLAAVPAAFVAAGSRRLQRLVPGARPEARA